MIRAQYSIRDDSSGSKDQVIETSRLFGFASESDVKIEFKVNKLGKVDWFE